LKYEKEEQRKKSVHVADDTGRRVQRGRGGGFFGGNNGVRHGQKLLNFEGF
jgi:hypothetical protein